MKHRRFCKFVVLASITCMGASALLGVWCPMLDANPATDPAPGKECTRPPATRWPLNQHGIAAERELFLAPEQGASPHREIPQAGTSPASKSLGLKLKGTVVTGHQGLNVAIIEHLGRQKIYYEGDRAGQVQIQKVLRYKAIITIGSRDELLAMTFQKNAKEALALNLPGQNEHQPATDADLPIRLDRVELASSLENLHELMKSARIHSYKNKKGTKPTLTQPHEHIC